MSNPMTPVLDPWFETLGDCLCGEPAIGTIRGSRGERIGVRCRECARQALASQGHSEVGGEGDGA